jgi:hypothetical protein
MTHAIRIFRSAVAPLAGIALASVLLATAGPAKAWDWGAGTRTSGSGNITITTRSPGVFSGLALELPGSVEVVQGRGEGVVIETDDNIAPLIETTVKNNTLVIRLAERNASISPQQLRMTVTTPSIESLSVAGSGTIFVKQRLQAVQLKCSIAGSGDLRIDALEAGDLRVSVSGSGDLAVAGHADSVSASVAGSGDLHLSALEAKHVKVSVAGSGDATVWAKDTLTVNVAGSGDIRYYGDATVSKSIAGSGSVRRLGFAPSL